MRFLISASFSIALAFHAFLSQCQPAFAEQQEIIDYLEVLLYQDAYISTFLDFPCDERENTTTAAQWLRLAYHDMSTHNVDDGTGGLDGSIAYELDRPQNVGPGMLESLNELVPFTHPSVGFADILAFAAVRAVDNCDGPKVPLRGGRVDATSAGPPTVPEPHQDLASHTESFRRQGFNQSEMIALVACGHSLGGVRRVDFPEIIHNEDADLELFDGTQTFDHAVSVAYFVLFFKLLTRSLADSDTFNKTCGELIERMINTVPKNVELTDVVTPIQYKAIIPMLSLGNASEGTMTFTVNLRVIGENKNRKVKLLWNDRDGSSTCPTSGCSTAPKTDIFIPPTALAEARYGLPGFTLYFFETSVNMTTSMSKFWFEVIEGDGMTPVVVDKGSTGKVFAIPQDKVLYDPVRSRFIVDENNIVIAKNLVVAVRGDPSNTQVSVNTWQASSDGTNPKPIRALVDLNLDPRFPSMGGYSFFSANATLPFSFIDIEAHVAGETIGVPNILPAAS
ncbi:hypothetical protein AAF712_015895 [Marasmius tenuissimus]|uniref:Peroxidase n=1 Tax=Marasmius tenuissimus TaxID=585030 RepID=A0ABR2Z7A2_9AGAR